MKQDVQQALLSELIELKASREQYLDEHWVRSPLTRYGEVRFAAECEKVFRRKPLITLHAGELAERGSFVTGNVFNLPLLFARGADGKARCFLNVCRHRGAELVGQESGCRHKFTCPYHAWTYDTQGRLVGVPHEKSGFPGLDRDEHGLTSLPCEERHGWIWILATPGATLDVQDWLGGLSEDIAAIDGEHLVVFDTFTETFSANWKFIVEGGLESYHFRVAHKDTIADLFQDNLSSYQTFGPHIRSVLPRSHLPDLTDRPATGRDIKQYANLLYTIFPLSQFLVQQDHVVWVRLTPLSADKTDVRISTLIPAVGNTEERASHWRRNHDLTVSVLKEDFAIGEGIQRGLGSGANAHFNLGRYEGALDRFNKTIEACLTTRRD